MAFSPNLTVRGFNSHSPAKCLNEMQKEISKEKINFSFSGKRKQKKTKTPIYPPPKLGIYMKWLGFPVMATPVRRKPIAQSAHCCIYKISVRIRAKNKGGEEE